MDYLNWKNALTASLAEVSGSAAAFVPNLLGAAILLFLGWLVACLARTAVKKLLDIGFARLAKSALIEKAVRQIGVRSTIPWLASAVVYWIILLFFAAAAVDKLRLPVASDLVSRLALYLPNLLAGLLLAAAAVVVGRMANNSILRAGSATGMPQAPVLGRSAEILIIFAGIVIGIDQAGIQSSLLTIIVTVFLATLLGGVALAFGLGSGAAVSNLISSRYLTRLYRVGQRVRIDGLEGQILEMTQTGVVLDGADGRVLVPARKFSEQASVLLSEGQ